MPYMTTVLSGLNSSVPVSLLNPDKPFKWSHLHALFSWAQPSNPTLDAFSSQTIEGSTCDLFIWLAIQWFLEPRTVVWWEYMLNSFFHCMYAKRDRRWNCMLCILPSFVFWEVGLVTSVWTVSVQTLQVALVFSLAQLKHCDSCG